MNTSMSRQKNSSQTKSAIAACPVKGITAEIKTLLDQQFPLDHGSHHDAVCYSMYYQNLMVHMNDGSAAGLLNPDHLHEVAGRKSEPEAILLDNDRYAIEINLNKQGCSCLVALHEH